MKSRTSSSAFSPHVASITGPVGIFFWNRWRAEECSPPFRLTTFDDVVADRRLDQPARGDHPGRRRQRRRYDCPPPRDRPIEGTYTLALGELAIDDADALTIESAGRAGDDRRPGRQPRVLDRGGERCDAQRSGDHGRVLRRCRRWHHQRGHAGDPGQHDPGKHRSHRCAGLWNFRFGIVELYQHACSGQSGSTIPRVVCGILVIDGSHGSMVVTGCTFLDNTAGIDGGAINTNGVMVVTDSHFEGNRADTTGGANRQRRHLDVDRH